MPTRIVAAVLALLSVLPLWRLLPQRATGMAGVATANAAMSYTSLVWSGTLLALIAAVLATFLFTPDNLEKHLATLLGPLARPRPAVFAFAVAGIAALAASGVAVVVMDGSPTLIDSFAQLTHARYFANGMLAGPAVSPAWHIQQTIATDAGWVSQYPPGYIALLAAGLSARGVTLVGPLMFAVATFFTALIANELFPSVLLARLAALLTALSPFMLGLSGAFMSHVPAAAFACAAVYFVMRARDGRALWAVCLGVSIGALFAIRPLTGVVLGVVAFVHALSQPLPPRAKLTRSAIAFAAALPFLLAVAAYNAHLFGNPTTFGYIMSLGQNAGLGFGIDPWGNSYGIVEALAYTSAELIALSLFLLETPIPLIALIGLHFALPSLSSHSSHASLVFWACAALVIANLLYWHHGLFMGPRMLADTGPLWVLLAVYAAHGLVTRIRSDWFIAEKYSVRAFATGGLIAPLVFGLVYLGPSRLYSYSITSEVRPLLSAPAADPSSLVFVHGGWTARVAMRLAAHGMRLDSVETALRQNSTCKVHHYSLAFARNEELSGIDFLPRTDRGARAVEISPGNRIRIEPNERVDASCAREIAADTAGVVDVTPYIWQGALPGIARDRPMFVRDMGPAENADVIAIFPDRAPMVALMDRDTLKIVDYEAGMKARWSAQ